MREEVEVAVAAKIVGVQPHTINRAIWCGELNSAFRYVKPKRGRMLTTFVDLDEVRAWHDRRSLRIRPERVYSPLVVPKRALAQAQARRKIEDIIDEKRLKNEIKELF
jgi:hypothetical protein